MCGGRGGCSGFGYRAKNLLCKGLEVMVLEAADAIGTGTSSRNSEVIHAGLYYPTGSLKRACALQAVSSFMPMPRSVAWSTGGAASCWWLPQMSSAKASGIYDRALSNGVTDLQWLDRAQAQAMEPALECVAALFSPSTGIIDSHGLMLALQGDLENAGGLLH